MNATGTAHDYPAYLDEPDIAYRRMRRAEMQRRRRREQGVIPREQYERWSATKRQPWKHYGVSRRTWERWRINAREENYLTDPSEEEIYDARPACRGRAEKGSYLALKNAKKRRARKRRKCEAQCVASVKPIITDSLSSLQSPSAYHVSNESESEYVSESDRNDEVVI